MEKRKLTPAEFAEILSRHPYAFAKDYPPKGRLSLCGGVDGGGGRDWVDRDVLGAAMRAKGKAQGLN